MPTSIVYRFDKFYINVIYQRPRRFCKPRIRFANKIKKNKNFIDDNNCVGDCTTFLKDIILRVFVSFLFCNFATREVEIIKTFFLLCT